MFKIVKNSNFKIDELKKLGSYYLSIDFGSYGYRKIPFFGFEEPQYNYNDKKIFIEEYIPNTTELRILMIKGEILYYEIINDSIDLNERVDNNWDKINVLYREKNNKNKKVLTDKLPYIEKINKFCYDFYNKEKIDFIRIDFLISGEDYYFGEFTFTPENCREPHCQEFENKFKKLIV